MRNARLAMLFRAIANELDDPEWRDPPEDRPVSEAVADAAMVLARHHHSDPEAMLLAILEAAQQHAA